MRIGNNALGSFLHVGYLYLSNGSDESSQSACERLAHSSFNWLVMLSLVCQVQSFRIKGTISFNKETKEWQEWRANSIHACFTNSKTHTEDTVIFMSCASFCFPDRFFFWPLLYASYRH